MRTSGLCADYSICPELEECVSVKWSSAQLPADHMAHTLEVFNTHGTTLHLHLQVYKHYRMTRGQKSYYIMEEAGDSPKDRDGELSLFNRVRSESSVVRGVVCVHLIQDNKHHVKGLEGDHYSDLCVTGHYTCRRLKSGLMRGLRSENTALTQSS